MQEKKIALNQSNKTSQFKLLARPITDGQQIREISIGRRPVKKLHTVCWRM